MSAALFDPDDIMRAVRATASSQLGAKTANLLKSAPGFSSLADLAALPAISGDNLTVCVVQKIGRVRLFEPFEEPAGPSAPPRRPLRSSTAPFQRAAASAFANVSDNTQKMYRPNAGPSCATVWSASHRNGPRTRCASAGPSTSYSLSPSHSPTCPFRARHGSWAT